MTFPTLSWIGSATCPDTKLTTQEEEGSLRHQGKEARGNLGPHLPSLKYPLDSQVLTRHLSAVDIALARTSVLLDTHFHLRMAGERQRSQESCIQWANPSPAARTLHEEPPGEPGKQQGTVGIQAQWASSRSFSSCVRGSSFNFSIYRRDQSHCSLYKLNRELVC